MYDGLALRSQRPGWPGRRPPSAKGSTVTTNPEPTTWAPFTHAELRLIRAGLAEVMDGILDMARSNTIPRDDRRDAAISLLASAKLAFNIDEALGDEHPPLEVFALSAELIRNGTYGREVAAVVAEVGEAA